MDELIGTTMGRYRLEEKIGEGGMAAVYKALDTTLERKVAIKVITAKRQASDTFLKRFEREAKALAKLNHPGIMDIHDYGEQDGHPYIVMEYLPNGTLKQYMGRPIRYQQAAKLLTPIAEALAYAHKQGIIHRDVKPANILFSQHNKPMIGDFGIVKVEETDNVEALTQVGTGIGTPAYMSPEQGRGSGVDHRTDIYALGVVFYELITGRRPYEAPTPTSFFFKQMTEPLPDPRQFVPSIPQEVVDFVNKALSVNAQQRIQSMDEFAQTMESFITGGAAKPKFEEAATRMVASEEATMLASQTDTPLKVPPPTNQFNTPGTAQQISTPSFPSTPQQISTPPAQSISTPPAYDSSNSLPPTPNASPAAPKKKKKTWIIFAVIGGLIALALLCFGGLALIGFLLEEDPEPTQVVQQFDDPTDTPTQVPAEDQPVDEPANPPAETGGMFNGGNMTEKEMLDCMAKAGYTGSADEKNSERMVPWVCDNFDDNKFNWYLQPLSTDYISGQTSIVDGKLRMQMTSKQIYAQYWQWAFDINTNSDLMVGDFLVRMKIRRVQGPEETLIGVDFRENANDQFYSMSVYESDDVATIEYFNGSEYSELEMVDLTTWYSTDWNEILIWAEGDSLGALLNGTDLITSSDSTLLNPGELSLWIGAVNENQTIVYEIDDVFIYSVLPED